MGYFKKALYFKIFGVSGEIKMDPNKQQILLLVQMREFKIDVLKNEPISLSMIIIIFLISNTFNS